MKTPHVVALSILAGVVLGAVAVQGLHAQAKPPVYVVVDFGEITNPQANAANTDRSVTSAAALLKDFGGQYLARTEQITALDGTAPKRFIITRFDSAEKAKAWYNSPEQRKVNEIRLKNTTSRLFIVEGMVEGM